MNQVFLSGIALIIAFVLWNSKKHSYASAFFKSKNDSLKTTNTSTSLVQKKISTNSKQTKNLYSKTFSNQTPLNSIKTRKQLNKLISSNPDDRLLAIQIASQWNNKKALPFLRRGLKDSDRRVVIASAASISSYRGKTINLNEKAQASRPPRNVSLIR